MVLAVAAAWRAAGAARLERALAVQSVPERIARLDAVVADHPYLVEAFRARGLAWRDWPGAPPDSFLARYLRAERDLRRAIELRPRWAEPRADLAFVLAARGNRAAAEAMLAEAVALDPTHLGIGAARAEFLARTEGPAAAVGELKRLRVANPGWPAAAAITQARRWTKDPALLQALAAAP
jgi:tetratricopeptide (TPR) repeat protein